MKIIGIDLGGTNIKGGLVHDEKLVRRAEMPTRADVGGEVTLGVLKQVIRELWTPDCEAIGLGVASVVDRERGIAYDFSNIAGWDCVPLKEMIESEFGVPVAVDNDANCFALSELHFGQGRRFTEFVGVTLGTGVGAGIIHRSELLSDANCGSGEFGMIPYRDSIIEDYCASRFFPREFGCSGAELAEKASQGDEQALQAFREYGRNVGQLAQIIMYAVDPQAIIFGGSIAQSFKFFEDSLKESLSSFAYPRSAARIRLLASDCAESGIMGAAALCL